MTFDTPLSEAIKEIRRYLKDSPDGQALWDILTALRGPDNPTERGGMSDAQWNEQYRLRRARKRETVEVIRGKTFPNCGEARCREDIDYVTLPPKAEWDHFDKHVARAAHWLGLRIEEKAKAKPGVKLELANSDDAWYDDTFSFSPKKSSSGSLKMKKKLAEKSAEKPYPKWTSPEQNWKNVIWAFKEYPAAPATIATAMNAALKPDYQVQLMPLWWSKEKKLVSANPDLYKVIVHKITSEPALEGMLYETDYIGTFTILRSEVTGGLGWQHLGGLVYEAIQNMEKAKWEGNIL